MRGFIALTSVLILSVIMLGFVIAGSTYAFYARSNGLEQIDKAKSEAIADSCTSFLLLKLAQDESHEGDESYGLDGGTCRMGPVEKDGFLRLSSVSGTYSQAVTTLEISFDITDSTYHAVQK